MNKKGKKTLGIVFLLVSFALIGAGVYLSVFSTKNRMFKLIISEFESLYSSNEKVEEKFKNLTNGSVEIIEAGESQKLDFNTTIHSDLKNEQFLFDGGIKVSGIDLGTAEIYLDKNKLYFKVGTNPLTYIELEETSDSILIEKELEEIKEIVKDEIFNNIPNKNFKKSNENVTINENNLETEKFQMTVTLNDLSEIISNTYLEIRENKKIKKFNETISQTLKKDNITDDQFVTELKKAMLGENNENKEKVAFEYFIYVLKDKVVKHELKIEDVVFSYGKYEKETNIFDYEFITKVKELPIIKVSVVGAKDSSKINATFDRFVLEGQSTKTDNKNELTLNLYQSENREKALATFEHKENVVNDVTTSTTNLSMNLSETESFKFNLNNSYHKNVEMPKYDTSNAQKLDLGSAITMPMGDSNISNSTIPSMSLNFKDIFSSIFDK